MSKEELCNHEINKGKLEWAATLPEIDNQNLQCVKCGASIPVTTFLKKKEAKAAEKK